MTSPLTGRSQRIFAALSELGGWRTRAEIAKHIGKARRLDGADALALDYLVENKVIEVSEQSVPPPSGIKVRSVYRAK